jgi:hypothetical protein
MSASKLVKKLLKLKTKDEHGGYNASTSSSAVPSSPGLATTTAQQLPRHLLTASNSTSNFFSLPGEIRNQIYAHVTYPSLDTISIYHHPEIILSIPVFHICHQIRSEAISYLCSNKTFYFSSLTDVNNFFSMISAGAMPSLRHITICDQDWCVQSSNAEGKRTELLEWLKHATSLKRLDFIIGRFLFGVQDGNHLEPASSPGVEFLYALRDTVDKEDYGEGERGLEERFGRLCEDLGVEQAVRNLRERLIKEDEMREEKVFRLQKVVSLEGKVEELKMPCRKPGFLRGIEENKKTECGVGRD